MTRGRGWSPRRFPACPRSTPENAHRAGGGGVGRRPGPAGSLPRQRARRGVYLRLQGVPARLVKADMAIAAGMTPAEWWPEHRHLDVVEARAVLGKAPEIDRLVVCHEDACVPNTHDRRRRFLHRADRPGSRTAWPTAGPISPVAAWSAGWNWGGRLRRPGLRGLRGGPPNPERIAYYRLLWDLT